MIQMKNNEAASLPEQRHKWTGMDSENGSEGPVRHIKVLTS